MHLGLIYVPQPLLYKGRIPDPLSGASWLVPPHSACLAWMALGELGCSYPDQLLKHLKYPKLSMVKLQAIF